MILGGTKVFSMRQQQLEKMQELKRNKNSSDNVQREPVYISGFLSEDRVIFFDNASQDFIFEKLVNALPVENKPLALKMIHEREKIESTAINQEISFPHARISGLDRIAAALAINRMDDQTRIFFLFVSPSEDIKGHLRFLAAASALFLTENLASLLAELNTGEDVLKMLRGIEHA